jgi:cytochrome c oxidase subunit 1
MVAGAETVRPYRADWRRGKVASWLTTVDHKRIGLLYIWTSLVFFALGGFLALLIRIQLIVPNNHFMVRSSYNQAVTIHGTTMIFHVVVPILAGFGN